MKDKIGQKIKQLRRRAELTQQELADKVGVTKATINKYETGIVVNLKRPTIELLAKALDTTPSCLMGWQDDYAIHTNIEFVPETHRVPVYGAIACGKPMFADDNIEGYAELDARVKADFALRCAGDSMINARIFNGDLVYIKEQSDVENGEIAAVLIDGEATLKRVYKYPNRIELRPENPTFPVLQYEGAELGQIRIIGKAVAFLSNVR